MDEQDVADPKMRALAHQLVDDLLAVGRQRELVAERCLRIAHGRAHFRQHGAAASLVGKPGCGHLARRRAAAQGEQHQDLVVADQAVDPVDSARPGVFGPQPQHAERVGPAIDQVSEIDQPPRPLGVARQCPDGVEQGGEFVPAAVDVADRKHGLAVERERRALPFADFEGGGHGADATAPVLPSKFPPHSNGHMNGGIPAS